MRELLFELARMDGARGRERHGSLVVSQFNNCWTKIGLYEPQARALAARSLRS